MTRQNEAPAERPLITPWAYTSLVLGVLGLVLALGIGGLLGILALVTGLAARREVKSGRKAGGNIATAGMVLGAVALVVAVAVAATRS